MGNNKNENTKSRASVKKLQQLLTMEKSTYWDCWKLWSWAATHTTKTGWLPWGSAAKTKFIWCKDV